MSADLLALLDRDPAAGILAVADLRERYAHLRFPYAKVFASAPVHIAAETNPRYALAAVRRWRGAVERHVRIPSSAAASGGSTDQPLLSICDYDERPWPCPDLTETADEARAYVSGGAA